MKIFYYIITMIISFLLALLFVIPMFSDSVMALLSLIIVVMFLCLFSASLFGIIKKCPIPDIFILKVGIVCAGFALFAFGVGVIENHLNLVYFCLIAFFSLLSYFCIANAVKKLTLHLENVKAEMLSKIRKEQNTGYSYHLSEGGYDVKKIWQYKLHAKPQLSEHEKNRKITFLFISIIGIVLGFGTPFAMLSAYDMEDIFYSIPGSLFYFLSIGSIFFLAMTLGSYKSHNSQNIAFVLHEDGSVFLIDYFDRDLARQFGYYNMLPRVVRTGGIGANIFTMMKYGFDADRCLSFIRTNGIDKKIAAGDSVYGYQIIAVPEIVKCGFFTEMKFLIWKDEKETLFKRGYNQYDNCYEDYEMMISYFDGEFEHRFDEKYEKKTNTFRGMVYFGLVSVSAGLIVWISGLYFEIDSLFVIGFLLLCIGASILMTGLDNLSRRKKD